MSEQGWAVLVILCLIHFLRRCVPGSPWCTGGRVSPFHDWLASQVPIFVCVLAVSSSLTLVLLSQVSLSIMKLAGWPQIHWNPPPLPPKCWGKNECYETVCSLVWRHTPLIYIHVYTHVHIIWIHTFICISSVRLDYGISVICSCWLVSSPSFCPSLLSSTL